MKKLDERQLLLRGNIFMRITFTITALLLLSALLVENGYNIAEGMWSYIFILIIPLSVGLSEMILRDVLPFKFVQKLIIFLTMGVAGLALLILSIIHLAEGSSFFAEKSISEAGAFLIMGIFYMAIMIIFLIKKIINNKKRNKEEEV